VQITPISFLSCSPLSWIDKESAIRVVPNWLVEHHEEAA